ncbi:MAG: acyl-CoA desaturase [Candidatus Taylorbacteria bacterium]|nr:acyl-CoA desaturase [Candidatus Taylorbacteria bacterium]
MKNLPFGAFRNEESEQVETLSFLNKFFTFAAVFIPPTGVLIAIIQCWGWGVNITCLLLTGLFYFVTGFGITVGYHRLFTHRSFQAKSWLRIALGIAGSMALEGSVFDWTTWHGWHHDYSDTDKDQHSPHRNSKGFRGKLNDFLHAHVGWIFHTLPPNEVLKRKYIPHLISDPLMVFVNKYFPLWALLSLALPTLLGGLLEWSWKGAFLGFLWGGLVRIFLVHHITWSINSVCHIWGRREYGTGDQSTDNWFCRVFGLGEGGHCYHHMWRYSARHGFRWWEFDPSYILIKILEKLGAVSKPLTPKREEILKEIERFRSIKNKQSNRQHR